MLYRTYIEPMFCIQAIVPNLYIPANWITTHTLVTNSR
jgi:hypothetical protein